jgi:putative oxidoreductase
MRAIESSTSPEARNDFVRTPMRICVIDSQVLAGILAKHRSQFALGLAVGGGFIAHAWAKLSSGPDAFAAVLQVLLVPVPHITAWLTILVELVGGLAVVLRAFISVASVPLAAVVVVAMLTVQWHYGFNSIKLVA